MNERMTDKGVFRTALATPGVFKTCAQGLIFVFDFCKGAVSLTAKMSRPRCSSVGKGFFKSNAKDAE